MEQFDLSLYLKDKTRKVVTRDGREAIIVCTNADDKFPVVAKIRGTYAPFVELFNSDGTHPLYLKGCDFDLFFADEEPETIEVPFGAKDSEFIKDEYFIPEGCEARIEGNKVIIKRVQKEEELTEFEQKLVEILKSEGAPIGNIKKFTDKDKEVFHCYSKQLLDLARKELEANYYTKVLDDKMVFKSDLHDRDMQGAYELGKQDALKSLPKWKKGNVFVSNEFGLATRDDDLIITRNGYQIKLSDLTTLPKEK